MFKLASVLAITLLVFGAQSASACISGPLPLAFIGNTPRLSNDGKYLLQHYGRERQATALLIIFYKSDLPAALVQARQVAVEAYMKSIRRNDFTVVRSRKPLPPKLLGYFGHRVGATVEPTQGCG